MRTTRRRYAFTLIEVLVTLVVMTMFAAAVYGVFMKCIVNSRAVLETEKTWRQGQSILRLMERDLSGCLPCSDDFEHFEASYSASESGELSFYTSTDSRTFLNDEVSDVTRVTYAASSGNDGMSLFRREAHGSEPDSADEGGIRMLADNVTQFSLTYFDGNAWHEAWAGPELPVAVRVSLGLQADLRWSVRDTVRSEEFIFSTVVDLPAGIERN